MFVVEAMDNLRSYLFLDERFVKIICSSMDVFRNCFILQQAVLGTFFFIDRHFAGNFLFFDFSPFDKTLMHG